MNTFDGIRSFFMLHTYVFLISGKNITDSTTELKNKTEMLIHNTAMDGTDSLSKDDLTCIEQ